jgi:hypothetical protein
MKIKQLSLAAVLFLGLVLLGGCFSPNISLQIKPSPIEFSEDELSQEIILEMKTEGLGEITLNNYIVEVMNKDGEVIFSEKDSLDISDQLIIGGITETQSYTVNLEDVYQSMLESEGYSPDNMSLFYQEVLKGQKHSLKISVTGSINPSVKTDIIFN